MGAKRAATIEFHCAAKTNSEIVKLLKAARSTVYYTVTRFRKLKSTEDRPRCERLQSSGRRQRSLMLSEPESGTILRDSLWEWPVI